LGTLHHIIVRGIERKDIFRDDRDKDNFVERLGRILCYKRHGQLFQNRYKSILCEEDPYLLELVRYIHLNPIRVGLIKDLRQLRSYRYSGHAVLMGTLKHDWLDKDYVLRFFRITDREARKGYYSFVVKGIKQGRRPEIAGGGLVRSVGG
jgi:hypothetical protein